MEVSYLISHLTMELVTFLGSTNQIIFLFTFLKSTNQMILLFQIWPLLHPLNYTFSCHNGLVLPIIINDKSRILDIEN